MAMPVNVHWVTARPARTELARAIAEIMVGDPAYICRDEYTDGFSANGKTWNTDAADALTDFFLHDPDMQNRLFVQASDHAGHFLGGAVIEPGHNGHENWWTIEDFVISPAARRQGIGDALISFLMAQAAAQKIARLMLESGVANQGAHDLFARKGFTPISTLYSLGLQ